MPTTTATATIARHISTRGGGWSIGRQWSDDICWPKRRHSASSLRCSRRCVNRSWTCRFSAQLPEPGAIGTWSVTLYPRNRALLNQSSRLQQCPEFSIDIQETPYIRRRLLTSTVSSNVNLLDQPKSGQRREICRSSWRCLPPGGEESPSGALRGERTTVVRAVVFRNFRLGWRNTDYHQAKDVRAAGCCNIQNSK